MVEPMASVTTRALTRPSRLANGLDMRQILA
jgi:hypothetical protein